MLISVDPHKNMLAYAVFKRESLVKVEFIQSSLHEIARLIHNNSYTFDTCVVEAMFIYPKERVKNPNDLIDVAKMTGLCYLLSDRVVEYYARTWKGQVPKGVMNGRIRQALTDKEKENLGEYKYNHHVLDAVGIGLYHLKRL